MSNYSACGVQAFTSRLALDIQYRLSDFAAYVLQIQKSNPEAPQVRSKEQWTKLYLEWTRDKTNKD